MTAAMSPVWTHPVSGATLWVGSRHFSRVQIEDAAIGLVVSAANPPGFLGDWASETHHHHAFLFADEPRLPDARGEREAVALAAGALAQGVNTLVHCQGGYNRSAYLAAKIMIELEVPSVAAIERIRQRRSPRVLGNTTFLAALVPSHEKERLARARRTSRR